MGGIIDLADRYLNGGRRKRRAIEAHKKAHLAQKNLTGGADAWLANDDFRRAKALGVDGIPDARCFTLQGVVRGLAHLDGDIAECGVRLGKSTLFMLEADRRGRHYRLFDSFEGLSEPSQKDEVGKSGRSHWNRGDLATAESAARANLAAYTNVELYRGWIPDRFPDVADCAFALLHVDVDLYQPTLDSLAFFWPRLVSGGVVVCDDYGFTTCPGAKRAMDEFFAERETGIFELTTGQALVVKGAD